MDIRLRPLPYDTPQTYAQGLRFWMTFGRMSRKQAAMHLTRIRHQARRTPLPGETCGAHARTTGKPCQAPAGPNGRCKLHGGKSTGPRTAAGLARAVRAMQEGVRKWREGGESLPLYEFRL
jgi:hypothetical protein